MREKYSPAGSPLARVLLHARELKNYSQRQLGQEVGATGSYISALESGKNLPGRRLAQRLALALDLAVSELWEQVERQRTERLVERATAGQVRVLREYGRQVRLTVAQIALLERLRLLFCPRAGVRIDWAAVHGVVASFSHS